MAGRPMSPFYAPDQLGKPCPRCGLRVPLALAAEGYQTHPTCNPQEVAQPI